jgi:hypothetical protein
MAKQPSSRQTARLRAEMIMKVRCGLLTARQAAARTGRLAQDVLQVGAAGLNALLDSVTDQPPGRPSLPADDHRQWLEKQLQDANRQIDLLNHKMALKDVLADLKLPRTGSDRAKKK